MKSLETTLTWILLPAFLIFTTSSIISTKKANDEEAIKAKMEEERAAKFVNVEIDHDGDPKTNTKGILIEANGSDEDTFSYSWAQISGENISYEGDSTNSINFDAGIGEYEFTVKVTDAYGATAIDTVSIKVNPEANECPEVYTEVYELIESEDEMPAENDDTEE